MKSSLNLLYLLASILLIYSCKGNSKQEKQNSTDTMPKPEVSTQVRKLTRIDALYFNYIFENKEPIKPEDIKRDIPQFEKDKKGVLDAEIADSLKIEKIEQILSNLQPAHTQNPIDARIVFILNYDNNDKDTLCLGGIYSDKIYLNRTEYSRSNKLLFTLKNYIGFYPWLIGDDMFNMTELQDNSFPKPPFTSSSYYKQYQEALAFRQ